ncbi:LOW QUALITY PROTEIN: schlafen family member 11 [Acomys russatus]|uniref:LOW QUALITY PROTEIN: schlafen family member 11 n=1 Tax=Acomys russatus TaxID=60746 RepID=UPI0021E1F4E4|nr:LOW QUALITY PROTEIN: schlafen family member 11 [Acomys russatus]
MEMNPSLEVIPSHPDLVIYVGEVTLGEENRKKMDKRKKTEEKERIIQAACALLNSGGGVIEMQKADKSEHPVEMGLDLEQSLRELGPSSNLHAFLETKQRGNRFYIFVKSWSCGPEEGFTKPRICSLSSSLYSRGLTSKLLMDSRAAFEFLEDKKRNTKCNPTDDGAPHAKIPRVMSGSSPESNPAFEIFQSEKLEYGQSLLFPETTSIEFKQFSTKHAQEYIKSVTPEYISAFANTHGGYLFIGVDDKSKRVLGCPKDHVDRDSLKTVANEAISKLPVFHFSSCKGKVSYETRVIDVFREGHLYGYLCVIKVEPFCCAVFSGAPVSFMVDKVKGVYSLSTEEWVGMLMDVGPEAAPNQQSSLSDLSQNFECQLSLSNSPPRCRPVYSKKGLEHKVDLQKRLFPVSPGRLRYTPKSLWTELCSQHERLEDLISQQVHPFSCGVLIISRSWAVDLDLEEKQGVICDALLIAEKSTPILYTILEKQEEWGQGYCTCIAFTLKQKLVTTGGYTGRLCVLTKVLCLSPENSAETHRELVAPIDYPSSYKLVNAQALEALLQALVIVLLTFRSFLSDQLGCEILNLLTAQQYEILSKSLRKTRKLFVHGLPGSGKTIMAIKIMEKIKNTFHCETNRILYICENQHLRDFIRAKNLCQVVTRTTFMRNHFKTEMIQHIIVDEAQNFRTEDGDWYEKAERITQRQRDCPGILWIFLDYFQTSHLQESGLPQFSRQDPKEELTKVVRNADKIAAFLQKIMQEIRNNPPYSIPPESLEMVHEFNWSPGVSGRCELRYLSLKEMVSYVASKCIFFLSNGYSPHDIAVLFSTDREKKGYKSIFQREIRKKRESRTDDAFVCTSDMFDSIRRFSGLERSIVFGIDPCAAEPPIFHNLLLCLASRARNHLYILFNDDRRYAIPPHYEQDMDAF